MLVLWSAEDREQAERGVPPRERSYSPVVCVVLAFGKTPFHHPLDLRDWMRGAGEFRPYVPAFETLLLDLTTWEREKLAASASLTGQVLCVLRDLYSPSRQYRRAMREALARLVGLAEGQSERFRNAVWFLTQLTRQKRSPEDNNEVIPWIARAAKAVSGQLEDEVGMIAQTMSEVDVQRGIQIGEERAVVGLRSGLLQVLESKFGTPTASTREAVLVADLDHVSEWLTKAALANDLAEVGIPG